VRNLDGYSDFVQIPLQAGVRVERVRVTFDTNSRDISLRPCVFILRKGENIVETRIIEKNGRVENLANIIFLSINDQTG
jgi:hypothetical protein